MTDTEKAELKMNLKSLQMTISHDRVILNLPFNDDDLRRQFIIENSHILIDQVNKLSSNKTIKSDNKTKSQGWWLSKDMQWSKDIFIKK